MEPGQVIADRFEIERLAGTGGMGAVYRAHDRLSGAPVALKILTTVSPSEQQRFVREAELLASLRHPGIVRYLTHGVSEMRPYIAMEWLEGLDLEARLEGQGVTVDDALLIAEQAAAALGFAHARGIVHRDIKPSNLFLVGGDVAHTRVLDFGIARLRGARSVTATGRLVGTPGYMSPEQARGEKDVDPRTDVFALGCVLFACLTGRPAFEGAHPVAVLTRVLFEDAPALHELRPDLPAALDELVAKMMSKQAASRFAGGAEVAAALMACERSMSSGVMRASESGPPPSLGRSEERVVSVVLASPSKKSPALPDAATLVDVRGEGLETVRAAAAEQGAQVEVLADGSLVAILTGTGAATDMVLRAARCALGIHRVWDGPLALATGRAHFAGRVPLGEVVDRAALLVKLPGEGVRIDDSTAGLLGSRFEVRGERGLELRAEREVVEPTRTLLGKPAPCVGREQEIGTLMALFDKCTSEEISGAALVTGPAGIGKSRVRYELLKRLGQRQQPFELWISRGDSVRAGSPFSMLAPQVRNAAGIQEGEPIESRRRKLLARVARNVHDADKARVAAFLGEMIGVPFPDDATRELPAARVDGIVMGDQIRLAWQEFVEAETKVHPLLIVLEDLHWGDLPSVNLIDLGLRNIAEQPWLVIGFARTEVRELFPNLWTGRALQRISLGELARKSSERLVRGVLGASVTDAQVARIVERGAGNAFYLEELVRAHADGRGGELPETVLAMVEARLGALDPEPRRVLRAASVFGQVFWAGAVGALLGQTRGTTLTEAALGELAEREVIVSLGEGKFRGETEWTFRHANLREASYAMLTEDDRVLGHRLAAEWLEAAGEDDAVTLAEHWQKAGQHGNAVAWYRRAAEQALEGNDYARTLSLAEQALRLAPDLPTQAQLHALLGVAHRWRGEFALAAEHGLAAIQGFEEGSAAWFTAAAEYMQMCARVLDFESARNVFAQVMRVRPAPDAIGAQVACAAHGCLAPLLQGRLKEVDKIIAEVLLPNADSPDDFVASRVNALLGHRALIEGDLGEFAVRNARVSASCERLGQVRHVLAARGNLGYVSIELGDFAHAEAILGQVQLEAERIGMPSMQGRALNNLGNALYHQGRLAEAIACEERALELAKGLKEPRAEGASSAYRARMLIDAGRLEEAERSAREASSLLAPTPPLQGMARAILARVLLAQGRTAEAVEEATRASARADAGVEEGETLIRLTLAQVLRVAGDLDGCRAAITTARERLLARAARIRDPAFRQSFLERVPDSVETLRLAASTSSCS